jgi:hypothetical protein
MASLFLMMSEAPRKGNADSYEGVVENILASYRELGGINHIEGANLPSR